MRPQWIHFVIRSTKTCTNSLWGSDELTEQGLILWAACWQLIVYYYHMARHIQKRWCASSCPFLHRRQMGWNPIMHIVREVQHYTYQQHYNCVTMVPLQLVVTHISFKCKVIVIQVIQDNYYAEFTWLSRRHILLASQLFVQKLTQVSHKEECLSPQGMI